MKKIVFIVSFLFLNPVLVFSGGNYFAGAKALGLSHAFVSFSDTWSTFHNQAGLAKINVTAVGMYYESKFTIEELALSAGSVVLPVKNGTFGLSYLQFGKGSFKESKIGLAFAKQLSPSLFSGIQLDYFSQIYPENKRSAGCATFEGGLIYSPNSSLNLGVHIFNPVFKGIETTFGKIEIPATIRIGGYYTFSEMALITVEGLKETTNPFLLKTGIEFSPSESLSLRFGVSGRPVNFTAGIGYKIKKLTTDIAFSYHENLGISPSVSLQFEI